jgi:exosortase/archaeosortase family protein
MKKERVLGQIWNILFRYFLLLILAYFFFFTPFFYEIFLKLTIYPLNFLLNVFYTSTIDFNTLVIESKIIEIIDACVAVSAYFLLLCLNLLTPNIKRRFYALAFSFILLLLFNILRIFILSILFIQEYVYFEQLHKLLWYTLNILIVIGVWFLTAYIFKVKSIPVYSDFKSLIRGYKNSNT